MHFQTHLTNPFKVFLHKPLCLPDYLAGHNDSLVCKSPIPPVTSLKCVLSTLPAEMVEGQNDVAPENWTA